MKINKIVVFAVMFSLILSAPIAMSEENANALYVDDDGTVEYTSIQDAIDNASDGDIIYVYNGVYEGYFSINKSISLIGENKEHTIIDGDIVTGYLDLPQLPYLIWIKSDDVTISGFTIKNSSRKTVPPVESIAPPTYHYYEGVGVHIHSNGNTISGNIIQNNQGYGILLNASENTILLNNTITKHTQACIYVKNSSNNKIVANNIQDNDNGIIFHILSIDNALYHNNFINNTYYHAYSESSNMFYDVESMQGNYWDDYNSTDKNNDGIGDTWYNVSSNLIDEYPLMNPYQGRIIIDNFYVDEGSVQFMLLIGMVVAIIFCIPIGLWWRKKYFK